MVAAGAADLNVKTEGDEKAVAAADGVDTLPRWCVGGNTITDDDDDDDDDDDGDGDGSNDDAPAAMLPLRTPPIREDEEASGV